jgi:lipoprotein signal peptidase
MTDPAPPRKSRRPISGRILTWWFGVMAAAGVAFGLFAENRHPVVILFVVVGIGLIVLRVALRRPVPEIIPERLLLAGCVIGLVAFLIGNWFAMNLSAIR